MLRLGSQLLFAALLILLIGSCHQKEESPSNTVNHENFPDQEGWNSTLRATTNGQLAAIIQYGHMKRYEKQKTVYFDEGVIVDFYDKDGRHTSKLTSDKGKLDEKTNGVEAYDNVVVVSDSGVTLETEKLWWDNEIEKVVTDQFVTITTVEKDTLYGVGFESDQNLTNLIIKDVRGKTDKKLQLDFNKTKKSKDDSAKVEHDST